VLLKNRGRKVASLSTYNIFLSFFMFVFTIVCVYTFPSSAAALERMRPVASDRGAGWMDTVMWPSHLRGALWWWVVQVVLLYRTTCVVSRGEGATTAVICRSVVWLKLQLQLVGGRRFVGGPTYGSLSNNHGTCLSNENIDNQSKVVVPPVISHAWRQSVCLTPTHSDRQRHSSVT